MRSRLSALFVVSTFISIGLVTATETPATAAAPAVSVTTAVADLDHPWDVAFAPDGTMLFTQRPGEINASVGGQTRVLADPSDVDPEHERGMMGLAVDPEFVSNRFIYTCFASDIAGPTDVRVARWRVNDGYTALSNRTDIISGIPVGPSADRHVGCRLAFGPDGFLWVTTGDGTIGTAPQDKQSLAGKVLRVDRNGNGALGNPGGAFLPQIYTYGHRNPQGIAFRPSDGKPFSVEHGTDCDDEINALVPGSNYGWDPTTPGGSTSYTEARPMTDKARHPDAIDAVWRSGCPTIAPSGATFLNGSQWGDWNGALAVAVLKDAELQVFTLNDPGTDIASQTKTFDGTYGRLRTAVEGPDGDMYILQDSQPGDIMRVHPTTTPAGFTALTPVRALDTRTGPTPTGWPIGKKLDNGSPLDLEVAGVNGVPSNASAVVLNVTSTEATSALSYITAWPSGTPRPLTSSLNLQPNANVANSITVAPGVGGKVSFFTNTATTQLVVDVLGYYAPTSGDRFTGTSPSRVFDTRTGPVPAGQTIGQKLSGSASVRLPLRGGVVANDATAVVVNITATQASTAAAFVTAWPAGQTRPTASNLNLQPAYNVSNLALVKLGTGGAIDLYTNTGSTHLVVDVVGYFRPSAGDRFIALSPSRMLDTRSGSPLGGAQRSAQVAGMQGIPGDATSVVLNATATQASSSGGFLSVWGKGAPVPQPMTSSLNYRPPFNVPNQIITKVGNDDSITMLNGAGTVHIVLDASGYFTSS
jgi:glucose/arabinose dehydrogenase